MWFHSQRWYESKSIVNNSLAWYNPFGAFVCWLCWHVSVWASYDLGHIEWFCCVRKSWMWLSQSYLLYRFSKHFYQLCRVLLESNLTLSQYYSEWYMWKSSTEWYIHRHNTKTLCTPHTKYSSVLILIFSLVEVANVKSIGS